MNQKSKAYSLLTPSDNRTFYNEWASRYDSDFYDDIDRENYGYQYVIIYVFSNNLGCVSKIPS